MRVTLKYGDQEWSYWNQTCPPMRGDHVWVDRAPEGHRHIVVKVEHRYLSGEHSAVVTLDRVLE